MNEQPQVDIPLEQAKDALAALTEPVSKLDVLTLSKAFVQSGYFSDITKMAQAIVKIIAGRELGFGPVASMRHIYVHRGHIGLMAQLIASKVRESERYEYKILQCDDEACRIEFFRLGKKGAAESLGEAAFTIEEARRADLVKADSAWQTYPSDLLFARAMSRGQRRYCPDVFRQTVYSKEEIEELMRRDPEGSKEEAEPAGHRDLMPRRVGEAGSDPATESSARPVAQDVVEPPPLDASAPATEEECWRAFLGEPEPASTSAPAGARSPSQEDDERSRLIRQIEARRTGLGLKAGYFAHLVEKHVGAEGYARAVPAALAGLLAELERIAAPAAKPAPGPGRLTFTIGKTPYETAGMTRQQMLWSFDLEAQVEKKQKGLTRAILTPFGVEHRWQLTEEQGEQFLIRLSETLGIDPPWVQGKSRG